MKKTFLILLTAYCLLLTAYFAAAQKQTAGPSAIKEPKPLWGANGLEINNTPGNTPQQNPVAAASEDGGFIVAWEDGRAGYTGIFAQKINSEGGKLWAEGGVGMGRGAGNQNYEKIVDDGAGGLIAVWQDYRNGNADIYAQRVSSAGEKVWGKYGVAVCRAPAGQFAPEITSDGAGGAIIAWHDYRSGAGEDIFAQHLSGSGAAYWNADGIPICDAPGTQWYPKIAGDGAGGAIIVWSDGRSGAGDNNIFAQRIDGFGKTLWEKNGAAVCSAVQNQERPEILAIHGGAIVAWNDFRSGNSDVYLQKIGSDGAALWPADGVAAAAAPFSQENPRLAEGGAGGAVVAWVDGRQEENAIYAQKIDAGGNPIWQENGRLLAKSAGKQDNPAIIKLKTADWLAVWEDYRRGHPQLYAQKINSSGINLWQEGGVPLGTGLKAQEKPSAALSPDGGALLVWQDRGSGNYDIYSQKIHPDGSAAWGESGFIVCNAAGSVLHQNATLLPGKAGEIIAVFEDARSGFLNIYANKIKKSGTLLWGKNGLPPAKIKADQINSQAVPDGAGGAIIIWEDQRDPDYPKIFAQRITAAGKRAWENGSQPLAKLNARQGHPAAVSDGAGGAIVVWQDERNILGLKDLYAQRISGKGELLWGDNGVPVCAENGNQLEEEMVSDGAGGAIITWSDYRRGERNPDIYAQRLDRAGNLLWKKEGVAACAAPDVQRTPRISRDAEGGALIAWTDKGGGSYDIYAQLISGSGQPMWLTDGVPINQAVRTQQNPKVGGERIIVWEDYRHGNWDLFANGVSPQGKPFWKEDGIPLSSLPLTQYAPQVAGWKEGGVIAAWEDYRSGEQYEIFVQKLGRDGKIGWRENGLPVKSSDGARSPKIIALPKENAFVVVWEDYTGGGKAIFGQRFQAN